MEREKGEGVETTGRGRGKEWDRGREKWRVGGWINEAEPNRTASNRTEPNRINVKQTVPNRTEPNR